MGWTVWGSNPGGARFSAPVQTGPWAYPASYTMGTRFLIIIIIIIIIIYCYWVVTLWEWLFYM